MAETAQRRLAAIMFTDMVGYSALTQKNEALALELLEQHRELLRPIFPKHEGKEIKTIGDAFLVEFASAVRAVRCAVEIQKALVQHNVAAPPDKQIRVRIGLHVGDVIYQQNDVLGDGVNIASRIEPLASPGGICVSEDVERQIRNKIELPVLKLGKGELKNIQVPVGIYRIVLPWERRRLPFSERFVFRLQQKRTRTVAVALAAVVLLSGLGWWLVRERAGLGGPVDGPIVSLAVLPLQNLMGDPEQEYFVDGMTEALIADLSKIGALKVISRTSVMQYKGARKPLREIAIELGVDGIIEGSVLRAGERVRITARLIHTATDTNLWAESYERDLQDVLRLQSDVAQAIAREIEIAVTPEEEARLAAKRPVNPEAYEAYLKGRFFLNKFTPEGFDQGLAYLNQATEIDPESPLAYAGLALGYTLIGHERNPDALTQARAAARRATELGETLAETEEALAEIRLYSEWDFAGLEQDFQRALELNPSLAQAHAHYSWYLELVGRNNEAFAEMRRAVEGDPLTPLWPAWLGWQYWWAGQYDEAIEEARKSLELNPDFPWGLHVLGGVYAENGMYEEAIAAHQKMAAADPALRWSLAQTYALAGRRDEAREIAAEIGKEPTPMDTWGLAGIYTALGEKDEAFRWLEAGFESRWTWMPWIEKSRALAPLRDDPRFQDLVRRIGIPQ